MRSVVEDIKRNRGLRHFQPGQPRKRKARSNPSKKR